MIDCDVSLTYVLTIVLRHIDFPGGAPLGIDLPPHKYGSFSLEQFIINHSCARVER